MPMRDQVRGLFENRACPLCEKRAWDFENASSVVLVKKDSGKAAVRSSGGTGRGDLSKALENAFESPSNVHLLKLTCNNCGHTELLDAGKFA